MKIIVLHDKYSNEPMIVRPDAISMIRKEKDDNEEYSTIHLNGFVLTIKETIGDVMAKIKKAESEESK